MFTTHIGPHRSEGFSSFVWLLVTGPMPLNSSPTPPVYAWSVSQDLTLVTVRPDLGSCTLGSEKALMMMMEMAMEMIEMMRGACLGSSVEVEIAL